MKWNKFAEFCAQHLELAPILRYETGPGILNTQVFPTFQNWVETQVKYLAVRPWTSLDLSATNGGSVHYVVYYHIEENDGEGIGGRARYLNGDDGSPLTLQQTLVGAVEWHGLYWALQPNNPIVFDCVVRKHTGVAKNGYRTEALDLFIPQVGFQP